MGLVLKYAGNPVVMLCIVIGVLFGLYKWEGYRAIAAKREAEGVRKSLAMAEAELRNAESINRGALLAAENAAKEAERQALIAAAEAKKSRDRLRENNLLRRNIQDASTNAPVPDSIELLLDAKRVRGADAGPGNGGLDESRADGKTDFGGASVPAGTGSPSEASAGEHAGQGGL